MKPEPTAEAGLQKREPLCTLRGRGEPGISLPDPQKSTWSVGVKLRIFCLALLFFASASFAQSKPAPPCAGISTSQGCYTNLRDSNGKSFRDDDPFLFCADGMKERPRAWNPLQPSIGTWFPTPGYCAVPATSCPYVYGIGWTQREIDGVYLYMSVCPAAKKKGNWVGSGRPENTPTNH